VFNKNEILPYVAAGVSMRQTFLHTSHRNIAYGDCCCMWSPLLVCCNVLTSSLSLPNGNSNKLSAVLYNDI